MLSHGMYYMSGIIQDMYQPRLYTELPTNGIDAMCRQETGYSSAKTAETIRRSRATRTATKDVDAEKRSTALPYNDAGTYFLCSAPNESLLPSLCNNQWLDVLSTLLSSCTTIQYLVRSKRRCATFRYRMWRVVWSLVLCCNLHDYWQCHRDRERRARRLSREEATSK